MCYFSWFLWVRDLERVQWRWFSLPHDVQASVSQLAAVFAPEDFYQCLETFFVVIIWGGGAAVI